MTNEQIVELLDEIGERISGPAEQLFELAVRRTITGAVIGLVVGLMLAVAAAVAIRVGRKIDKRNEAEYQKALAEWEAADVRNRWGAQPARYEYNIDDGFNFIVPAMLVLLVAIVVTLVNLNRLVNVEWYAIQRLLNSVGLG